MSKTKSKKAREVIQYNYKVRGFEFLSQFAQIPVVLYYVKKGKRVYLHFATAEAAFQYFKTFAQPFREKIIQSTTGAKARYYGSAKAACPLRDDWDDVRIPIMRRVIFAKYTQNLFYSHKLLETGTADLQELAPWDREGFWGVNEQGEGENKAGSITQAVRTKIADSDYKFNPDHKLYDMTKYMWSK